MIQSGGGIDWTSMPHPQLPIAAEQTPAPSPAGYFGFIFRTVGGNGDLSSNFVYVNGIASQSHQHGDGSCHHVLKNTENVQVSTLPGLRADVQLHYWGGNKQDSPQSSSQFLLMTTLLKPPNPLNVCVYTDEMTSVGVAVAMVIWTD